MRLTELAARLIAASDAERGAMLDEDSDLANVDLGYRLKEICQDAWRTDPAKSIQAAAAVTFLARFTKNQPNNTEITALANWAGGIAALLEGQLETAVTFLDLAEKSFLELGRTHSAAATQLAKLIGLAMLGRYDEAVACGLRAREVFLAHGDQMEAGRIENNIGNLFFRRDRYHEAEEFQSAARARFVAINDQEQLAIINNCLANTHALLHKFSSAEELYEQAMRQAEDAGLTVTLAEIEGNIGNFTLLQGRYDRALDYLERSRRRYASLGMPHQSAIAEQEIADAYLELNLAPEASAIYERVIPKFSQLGMRAELARALAHAGSSLSLLNKTEEAHSCLLEAHRLYAEEGNDVGAAAVVLAQAKLHYREGSFAAARAGATEAEERLAGCGSWQRLLTARWLRAEAGRALGDLVEANSILEQTLREAIQKEQPQVADRCYTSLGLVAADSNDAPAAEIAFKQGIELIEELRAPLPGEDLRTAFFSEKLRPYYELVRLCLAGKTNRVVEAFEYVERARSRALADSLGGNLHLPTVARDSFEAGLLTELDELRQQLNYFYKRIQQASRGESVTDNKVMVDWQQALHERETQILEISRQLERRHARIVSSAKILDVAELQQALGPETALIEYAALDDELLAFVVTEQDVAVVRSLGSEAAIANEVNQVRFQIDALRHGSERIRHHLPDLTQRVQRHLQSHYDTLLRPLKSLLGNRRLVIVPQGALHYLPFHALHDGNSYLIERREVSYAPSAAVLQECLRRENRAWGKALLLGVADERIARVREEVSALAPLFPESVVLLDEGATVAALRREAPSADLIHLACHGQFRPDNPLFSSLQLGDGWLTVRDAYNLNLQGGLVTLSACETGLSSVAPGDELLGLARGFFAAGARSLVISLWTVDDDATEELMREFYTYLRTSGSPATALRHAQLNLMKTKPHPFFWSPFVLMGGW